MKTILSFGIAVKGEESGPLSLSRETFNRILDLGIGPGRNSNFRRIQVEQGSAVAHKIFELIERETGLRPQPPSADFSFRGLNADEFSCSYSREFEPSDYRNSEYFMIRPWNESGALAGRAEDGRIIVHFNKRDYRPKTKLGYVGNYYCPSVNEEVKAYLSRAGFEELYFMEVLTMPLRPASTAPIWSLHSSKKLPRLRNMLSNRNGRFIGDPTNIDDLLKSGAGLDLNDGAYLPAQPEYSRAELEAIGPFDIAEMPEWFGGMGSLVHPLVCTQRFRAALKKLRIQDRNLLPVRLVD